MSSHKIKATSQLSPERCTGLQLVRAAHFVECWRCLH